jgi:hypothetical protein
MHYRARTFIGPLLTATSAQAPWVLVRHPINIRTNATLVVLPMANPADRRVSIYVVYSKRDATTGQALVADVHISE